MKKILIILAITVFYSNSTRAARVITQQEIAQWFLDADLVLICCVNRIDTMNISHYDSVSAASVWTYYDKIREVYQLTIDSVIRSATGKYERIDSVFTPEFLINYTKNKKKEEIAFTVNSFGDTIGADTTLIIELLRTPCMDDSYFRITNVKKHVVFLSLTRLGYVTSFVTELSDSNLEFFAEVNRKGQSYVDNYFKLE